MFVEMIFQNNVGLPLFSALVYGLGYASSFPRGRPRAMRHAFREQIRLRMRKLFSRILKDAIDFIRVYEVCTAFNTTFTVMNVMS